MGSKTPDCSKKRDDTESPISFDESCKDTKLRKEVSNSVDTVPSRSLDVVVTEVVESAINDDMATTDILIVYCISEGRVHGPFETPKDGPKIAVLLKCTVLLGRHVSGPTVTAKFSPDEGTALLDYGPTRYVALGHSGVGKKGTVTHESDEKVLESPVFCEHVPN